MPMATAYDAIVIGTGQSGPFLAERMSREGWRVAVIERLRVGGTCVNNGCIPTKTLVASARVAHLARRAEDFGIAIQGRIHADMQRVKARKDKVVGASIEKVTKMLEGLNNGTLYRGHGRFIDAHRVAVNGVQLEARKIFINVGARAVVPSIAGLDQIQYLTNSSIMDLECVPPHLVIIGGGYVGLEFAQIYRRFGSEVTVIERGPKILSRDDEDVSVAIKEILEKEGIDVRVDTRVERIAKRGDEIEVHANTPKGQVAVLGSHLLLAIGRRPNTDDLGLEEAGVRVDPKGYIAVDDELRTNVPGIWAMGDCNGRGAFTHTSYNDFEIIAANLFDHDHRRLSDRISCYAVFTDPPLGRVGTTEAEARRSGRRILVAKKPMTQVGRARERSETEGFMKVLVDADTQEILGAAILGINGDEVVHVLLDVMYAKKPYTLVQRAMHIHPTVAELLPTLLGELKPL